MELFLIVFVPLGGSVLPLWAARLGRRAPPWVAAAVTALAFTLLLRLAPDVFAGDLIKARAGWIEAAGLSVAFRLDGLGFLFALLILGIGLLIILYARYYLPRRDRLGRFYLLLLLFMGSMLGIVLADNLILLVVFWELTSLSSFLLIGYWHAEPEARQGARMALTVTGAGGLALLGGVLLLGQIVGSYDLGEVLASGPIIRASELYLPALILVLLGAFTKSAQFPLHFWLPAAMAAPTPVSAYLHSATMVKAGVFLLARLHPALSGTDAWFYLVSGAGLATLLFAAYTALFKHDIKGLLAYSTVSHLGLITLLFGLDTRLSAVAGVFHILNHATFKASLFMAAGIIDHEVGSRDMRRVHSLFRHMPHTAVLAMVAAAAMAGVPLLNGFLSKEMFFAETLHLEALGRSSWLLPAFATLASLFSVAYSARFIHDVFFNPIPEPLPRTPHEPPRWMKIPVEVLVAACLLVGLAPALAVGPLLALASGAVLQGPLPPYSLAMWHGFNLPLLMSAIALAGGVLLYTQRRHLFRLHDELLPRVNAGRVYERVVDAAVGVSARLTAVLENGSLQRYLALFVATAFAAGLAGFVSGGAGFGTLALTPVDGVSLVAAAVLVASALGAAWLHRERLIALVLVGVVGLVVALAFVRFSAPDLALTQLSVEFVTTLLLLLALYFLPARGPVDSAPGRRLRDGLLAALAGLGAFALVAAVLTRPADTISGYFLRESVPGGGGTNVVNVILVDFRGFDTLGEITVLAIAALGIWAMVDRLRVADRPGHDGREWAEDRHPLILAMASRPLLPLALLVSLYLLLRGHNLPGGGFIAGLVAGVALILQYLASGVGWTEQRMRLSYLPLVGLGLGLAALTGFGSWFFERPFLTSAHGHLHLPVIGDIELASAMLFDVGVFCTVVGAVMLILERLGRVHVETAEVRASREATWNS
ncbi:monovalent cation/H+ antiporter subunit A [Sulfurifustis variabilis]|uniref:monovalent cation/H+ antiporter subunit A n=1 Tax=Sulfurifustis variabilis TaxID=1675686 RepID=UPI000BBA6040